MTRSLQYGCHFSHHIPFAKAMGMGLWDIVFSGPIGISAGFDTDAECFPTLFHLGVSHVEIGTVTPRPQKGNEAPRDFLLPEDDAVIQRYGQPSEGLAAVKDRLKKQMAKYASQADNPWVWRVCAAPDL